MRYIINFLFGDILDLSRLGSMRLGLHEKTRAYHIQPMEAPTHGSFPGPPKVFLKVEEDSAIT